MFNSLDAIIESSNKIIGATVFLYILFSGGIGVLFKIILTPLKIKITNTKLSKLDNELFDLQLLRVFHGIHVETKQDAELVQLAINQNVLTKKDFRFLSFSPAIGKYKRSKIELLPVTLLLLAMLILSFNIASALQENKYGYAIFSEGVNQVLVSKNKIYDPKLKNYITKRDCKKLPIDSPSIIKSSCRYITTDDTDTQDELNDAINSNNTGTIALFSLLVFILFFAFLGCISYSQYFRTNNIFCQFKDNKKAIKEKQLKANPADESV